MITELRPYNANPDNLPIEEILSKGDFLELKNLDLDPWSGNILELLSESGVLGVLIYIPGTVVQDFVKR